MTREEFDKLVHEVEAGVGRQPAALRRKVALLALLGYVGLLGWLGVVLLVSGALFATATVVSTEGAILASIFGLIVLGGGGFAVLRVLWVRLPPPEGRRVTAEEVPQLFQILEELRAALRSAPFHEVTIIPM